jgi:predicted N-acetyltransferase YhbS
VTIPETPGAPEPLTPSHDLSAFDCGAAEPNDWLRLRALKNEESGASRTYAVCAEQRVVGYYCLATGAIAHASGKVRRNMPDPIPVMVIGRLAVDQGWRSQGLGRALLRDAILRTVQAADIAGIRAILVHAKSNEARVFTKLRASRLASRADDAHGGHRRSPASFGRIATKVARIETLPSKRLA